MAIFVVSHLLIMFESLLPLRFCYTGRMIISFERLSEVRSENPQKKIVLACGTFDLLHTGHIDYLEWAHAQGDLLVVSMPSDDAIKNEKNPDGPVNGEYERMRIVDSLRVVDYVVPTKKYYNITKYVGQRLKPNVFAIYKDWPSEYMAELKRLFPTTPIQVCSLQKVNSSSALLQKLRGQPI